MRSRLDDSRPSATEKHEKLIQDSASSATLIKLEQRLHLFDFLLKLSNQMSAFGNLDDVLNAFVEIATRELNAERGTIFLNDPTTNELYSRVAQGHLRHEIRILNSSGIAGSVFTAQESLISLEPSAEWCAYA